MLDIFLSLHWITCGIWSWGLIFIHKKRIVGSGMSQLLGGFHWNLPGKLSDIKEVVLSFKIEFQNLIWFPSHYPKMDACLLRAIQMKLPTKDKLHQWGILQNNTCVLCNLYPEAISRLFFDCRYTSYIWALCKLKLAMSQQISSLTIEARMLNSTFRTKSQSTALARLLLAAAIWHI